MDVWSKPVTAWFSGKELQCQWRAGTARGGKDHLANSEPPRLAVRLRCCASKAGDDGSAGGRDVGALVLS